MKKSFYIKYLFRAFACLLLLCLAFGMGVHADSVREYGVTLDSPVNMSASNGPIVLKGYDQGTEPGLVLAGWIKTDLVMQRYEYTLNGGKTWIEVKDAVKERPDTKHFCPTTWSTAGFDFEIDVSSLPRGAHDIFVRGYTESGDELSVLAMLDVLIGDADTVTTNYLEVNLDAYGAKNGALPLAAGETLLLDAYNFNEFERAEIQLDNAATLTFGSQDTPDPKRFSLTEQAKETDLGYVAEFDLREIAYAGAVQLSTDSDAQVRKILFYYNVPDYYKGDLKLHFAASAFDYLTGANQADAMVDSDDTVGTYTTLYPTGDTNDPFIYFEIGKYLSDTQGRVISADHYRYAVITLQTPATNSNGLFRLFLCAGAIRGPSGDSHVAFQPINDGKWRTYVIPLLEENDWTGKIYGVRLDFIDANAVPSDYANISSIGLYPDLESAQAAAKAPLEIYHENGAAPNDQYKEEGRAPSGKADAITWFDQSLAPCFGGENQTSISFDSYGHVMLTATEATNDPYISFDLQTYAALSGTQPLSADQNQVIVLRVLGDKRIVGKNFTLYYYSGGFNYAEGTRTASAEFQGGNWEYLVYDMSDKPYWTDQILGMRLDFATQISANQSVCLSDILFFADMEDWLAYAAEHGISTGSTVDTAAPETTEPETERPSIEIPSKGPGLEYVPPESEGNGENQGCKSLISGYAFFLLFPVYFVLSYKNKSKKGDRS